MEWATNGSHGPGGISGGREPSSLPEATIEDYFSEDRVFPPTEAFRHQAVFAIPASTVRLKATGRDSGLKRPVRSTGSPRGTRCWSGIYRSPGGSTGGRSTFPTTVSIGRCHQGRGDKVAFHWEGEPGNRTRTISYGQLLVDVSRFANVLRGLGIGRGDRVAIYMPMIPACRSPCRVHPHRRRSLGMFGGLSCPALRDRILGRGGPARDNGRRWSASWHCGEAQGQR